MIRKGIAGCSNFCGQGVCASLQTWGVRVWSYIDLMVLDPSKDILGTHVQKSFLLPIQFKSSSM